MQFIPGSKIRSERLLSAACSLCLRLVTRLRASWSWPWAKHRRNHWSILFCALCGFNLQHMLFSQSLARKRQMRLKTSSTCSYALCITAHIAHRPRIYIWGGGWCWCSSMHYNWCSNARSPRQWHSDPAVCSHHSCVHVKWLQALRLLTVQLRISCVC